MTRFEPERSRALFALLLLLPSTALGSAEPGPAPETNVVELEDVLASVDAQFPLLEAARTERDLAAGSLRSAEGSFDLRLLASGDLRPTGFYENYTAETGVEQQTRFWGARLFGGYRIGRGDFPSYDGDRQTDRAGEVRGGVELPLLRGRSIDPARARLAQARVGVRRAEPEIELQRIDFVRQATLAYWDWVATGLAVGVAERLLAVAADRQGQLARQVERGVTPRIDRVDNDRLVVDRRIRLLGAKRDAEQARVALSLFLRDEDGLPVVAGPDRLPQDFPPEDAPDRDRFEAEMAEALRAHPLLRSIELRREALEVERDLARNDRMPRIDLRTEASQDYGSSLSGISSEGSLSLSPRDTTEVKVLVRFELPVQRREADGRFAAASARLARLTSEQRFARDRVEAEVRRAVVGLETAYAQTVGARENLALALELQRAEKRKLGLGASNLINVNIREVQAADAGVALIESQAAYFRARADYRAVLAGGP